jgi:hypothetical protein
MNITALILHLQQLKVHHGDLDIAIAGLDQYFSPIDKDIMVQEIYLLDDKEDIVEGYENGKKAVTFGNL